MANSFHDLCNMAMVNNFLFCYFDDLPTEVMMEILKKVETEDLIRCREVGHTRLRKICKDKSLWKKIDFSEKFVTASYIKKFIYNGFAEYLNLAQSKIVGSFGSLPKLLEKCGSVKYLNLSKAIADEHELEKLISSCQNVEKLSLANLSLDPNQTSFRYPELQVLDLGAFHGMNERFMRRLLFSEKLTEISFRCTRNSSNTLMAYHSEVIKYLVEHLPVDVEKVSLSGIHCLTDEHIETLVSRCKKIKELELCGCRSITVNSLTSIAKHLEQLVKLDVSMAGIYGPPQQLPLLGLEFFFDFQSKASLKVLNCQHPNRSPPEIEHLQQLMPQVVINLDAFGGDLGIANPNKQLSSQDRTRIQTLSSNENFDPSQITTKPEFGLWEIK